MKNNLLKIAAVAVASATVVLGASSAAFAAGGKHDGSHAGTHVGKGTHAGTHAGKGTHKGSHGAGKHGGTTTTTVAS